MTLDIDRLKRLNAERTQEDWEACDRGDYSDFDGNSRVIIGDDRRIAVVQTDGDPETMANAAFITEAANQMDAILARLEEADRFEEALRQIIDESTGVDEDLNAGEVWCLETVASIARATLTNGDENGR
ncbi:hypothetical protein [Henriciella aquimarina]|uniref:hypothetical protein n=1 Tax=Henriciella aquimarina TaxID=545261 RepID=UPI000A015D4B|nr:hypothetical protein [Henriciella aquimarina]